MTDDQPAAIRLDQFLQLAGLAGTGGQAKRLIQSGAVTVNGQTETRRRSQLHHGDLVAVEGQEFTVEFDEPHDPPQS